MNLAPVPEPDDGQIRLSIEWPKDRERFNMSGKGLFTDTDLASLLGMRVGGSWSGMVRSANFDSLANDGQGSAVITVIVDDATVSPGFKAK